MNLEGQTIAVVGGGIGGMAAAAALAQLGAHVTVYEQAEHLTEVGAGLQISANGRKVLIALGAVVAGRLDAAVLSTGTEFRDGAAGRYIAQIEPPKAGPTWYMHRADVLALLTTCAEKAGVTVKLGQSVAPGGVEADLIVAADGMHSAWRAKIDGPIAPDFTGQVAWRALIPWDNRGGTASAVLSMGHGAHVVSYPLRQGSLMNLVAVQERRDWLEDSWTQIGDPSEFRTAFAQFGGVVGEMIGAVEHVNIWALHSRPVAKTWVRGAMVLLGDAAHPTLPFMAQGACLALEDAWVLRRALQSQNNLKSALQAYENARKTRADSVVALAKGNAWRFHMPKPFAWGAQAVLAVGAHSLARRLEWVYGYDADRAL
ncbi:MAG: FAD-dependent monooxygenase [Paracoccaceae bacterium]